MVRPFVAGPVPRRLVSDVNIDERRKPAPLSAAILAGGASRRLGTDKSLLSLRPGDPPLIARVMTAVRQVADDVTVVAPPRPAYDALGIAVVPDLRAGLGPLGGIETALELARHDFCLVTSCDLPFLDPALLRWLAEQPRDYEVLLPSVWTGVPPAGAPVPQPLHAIYARTALPAVRAQIAAGDLRLSRLCERLRARVVDEVGLRAVAPDLRSFLNVNTPEDARQATELLASERRDTTKPR